MCSGEVFNLHISSGSAAHLESADEGPRIPIPRQGHPLGELPGERGIPLNGPEIVPTLPCQRQLLMCSVLALSRKSEWTLMLVVVQAIQARQVLRGTVGELVKETRKQEAEGMLLATFPAALHKRVCLSKASQSQNAVCTCKNTLFASISLVCVVVHAGLALSGAH